MVSSCVPLQGDMLPCKCRHIRDSCTHKCKKTFCDASAHKLLCGDLPNPLEIIQETCWWSRGDTAESRFCAACYILLRLCTVFRPQLPCKLKFHAYYRLFLFLSAACIRIIYTVGEMDSFYHECPKTISPIWSTGDWEETSEGKRSGNKCGSHCALLPLSLLPFCIVDRQLGHILIMTDMLCTSWHKVEMIKIQMREISGERREYYTLVDLQRTLWTSCIWLTACDCTCVALSQTTEWKIAWQQKEGSCNQ